MVTLSYAPEDFARRAIAFDVETHKTQRGIVAPPLVCGSYAKLVGDSDVVEGGLLNKDDTLDLYIELLEGDWIIVGANIVYDLLVCAVEWAKRGRDVMPLIFAKLDRGEIFDIIICEQLHAIARGHLGMHPNGQKFKAKSGKQTSFYGLDTVNRLVLGVETAKVNDEWQLKYHELQDIPIAQWPYTARQYPVDDACNTLKPALVQVGYWARPAVAGGRRLDRPPVIEPAENLHDIPSQQRAAWAMHLGAAWGFTVDAEYVDELYQKTNAERMRLMPKWLELGIRKQKKEDTSQDLTLTRELIVRAYGATEICPECGAVCKTCAAVGSVPSAQAIKNAAAGKPPPKRATKICPSCKGDGRARCGPCNNTGLDFSEIDVPVTTCDDKDNGCGASGPHLCEEVDPPRWRGGVKYGRDVLFESGDDTLVEYSEWDEKKKIVETYIPYLQRGIGAPLTLKPNVLVETGRTSYGDVIGQFPREGGVRESIVARPGYLLCSSDYGQLELFTHGQSCLWLLGWSQLADALNEGVELHVNLAAKMGGMTYERGLELKAAKDAHLIGLRQAAKPGNYGYPGGMGGPKLVLQQRKQGPNTPAAGAPYLVDVRGDMVPGYKGLRFCILMRGRERCGEEKVTEWKGRPLPPTCVECIECSIEMRNAWFEMLPENRAYFKLIGDQVDDPGHVIHHVSRRKRGGVYFTNAANGYFQGLAADGAKLALYRVSHECFTDRNSWLYGSRPIFFSHDEIIAEVPEDRAHEAATRIGEIMVDAMSEMVPDVCKNLEAEPALMRRWYKGAEPVRDDAGRLIPWTPN